MTIAQADGRRSAAMLLPISFTVQAARPAAGSPLALGYFCMGAFDAPLSRFYKLCCLHPADPLVACQWRKCIPSV